MLADKEITLDDDLRETLNKVKAETEHILEEDSIAKKMRH